MRKLLHATYLFVLAILVPLPGAAQDAGEDPPPTRSVNDGVYTEEQAKRGATVFTNVCSECHATSEFTDPLFLEAWVGRTLFDIYDQIRSAMPEDNPGSLAPEQYRDVLTYMLQANRFKTGEAELKHEEPVLKDIKIDLPDTTGVRSATAPHRSIPRPENRR